MTATEAPDGQWDSRTAVIQPGETVTLPETTVQVTSPAQNVTWLAVQYRPDGSGGAAVELNGETKTVAASDSVRLPVWEVASDTPELTDHERSRARLRDSHVLHLAAIRDAIGSTPFQPYWRRSMEDLADALDKIAERAHHPDDVDWAHDATRCLAEVWYSGEYLESMTAHLWPELRT